jgi:S1-C subfamily serine protease
VRTAADLIETILEHKPGDVVKVRYRRGDKEREVEVTLGDG